MILYSYVEIGLLLFVFICFPFISKLFFPINMC